MKGRILPHNRNKKARLVEVSLFLVSESGLRPNSYFHRSRGYLPSAIIFSIAAINAGLSSL